ncbi:MAG TPA: HAMP domain-containing sensor histidine kinase [Rhizomicrobium sp.]
MVGRVSKVTCEKLLATLAWAAACIGAAMTLDYVVTICLLHNSANYTPLATFAIAALVTLPTTYALVSSRYNLRHARDDLACARDAAINAGLAKTMFFANMSHELRTPLNAIIGFSDLLATDVFANRRVEYAKLIHASGVHLLDLVNDLLEISKLEAGKLQLREESVAIDELIEECLKTVEPRSRAGKLHLAPRIEGHLPNVTADRRALKQILLNLLTNSIKFSGVGGHVEVFAYIAASGELALGVRDDGVGIAAEDLANAFEPFKLAHHDVLNVPESTGLGLPIVKGLAEGHGGHVTIESWVGEGTCVTVWLPHERLEPGRSLALAS